MAQVEKQGELSGHGPEGQERSQDLGEQQEEVDGVDGSLQGQDENSFIGQEEEQHRQLEDERQEPEGRQLWHLMTGRAGKEGEFDLVRSGGAKRPASCQILGLHAHESTETAACQGTQYLVGQL